MFSRNAQQSAHAALPPRVAPKLAKGLRARGATDIARVVFLRLLVWTLHHVLGVPRVHQPHVTALGQREGPPQTNLCRLAFAMDRSCIGSSAASARKLCTAKMKTRDGP